VKSGTFFFFVVETILEVVLRNFGLIMKPSEGNVLGMPQALGF
tara:strand:- start:389 stop:517 length:129 start_codon:yes stop_codon:yes gene_type:complete